MLTFYSRNKLFKIFFRVQTLLSGTSFVPRLSHLAAVIPRALLSQEARFSRNMNVILAHIRIRRCLIWCSFPSPSPSYHKQLRGQDTRNQSPQTILICCIYGLLTSLVIMAFLSRGFPKYKSKLSILQHLVTDSIITMISQNFELTQVDIPHV